MTAPSPRTKAMSAQDHIDMMGKKARDKITGFTGIVASVSFDLYGCIQAVLSPPLDKDGKPVDGRWFDIHRLEVVDHTRVMPVPQFAQPLEKAQYGATPTQHTHGPTEKPVPTI